MTRVYKVDDNSAMFTQAQIEAMAVGDSLSVRMYEGRPSAGELHITRMPDTKSGKPVYRIGYRSDVRTGEGLRGGSHEARSIKTAVAKVKWFANFGRS